MLTKKKALEIPSTLTVTGQGDTIKLKLTYNNLPMDAVQELLDAEDKTVADVVLAVVKEWESEYELSTEGLNELENDRPGMVVALIQGFYDARRMTKAKNS